MSKRCSAAGEPRRRMSFKASGGLCLAMAFLFLCPLLHAEEDIPELGKITIRDLQDTGDRLARPAPNTMAAGNASREDLQTAKGKPDNLSTYAAARQTPSDEYGDVKAEDVGEAVPAAEGSSDLYGDVATDEGAPARPRPQIADPLRPFNVAMYHFNDKLYFWLWKPASTGYSYIVPLPFRNLFRNFYRNLTAPVRILNNLFQGKPGYAGEELAKLLINSTVGVGGLRDCAEECFGIKGRDADFGQTLGKWGLGPGFYLVLPFLGPSSPRDGFGFLVDWTMRPQTYVGTEFFDYQNVGLFAHEKINSTSFHLGEYEALKKAAVDPYVSMRDIYIQYRTDLIENR
ncbi:MAG: putative phospholipid-binding lipoprotein MlaA precursor [Syntrophorhabdus sp. PtaB.Bin047]|nr:MAG: putative phospholipid-binding lipoprotein MlaA precursor [Syntrophorhabdus sp. PtaB.Bin047]